nr:hypothetical protein [Tanacetum cinerariifolium]
MVAILEKSEAVGGFEQIIDFLSGSHIHHALTVNPHVYISCIKQFWNTAVVKRSGDVTRLQALVDKKRIVITKEVVHEILKLNDAEGVICLPNDEIFAGLARMGYEKPSTKLTFYKAFFSSQWVEKGFSGVETPLFEIMLAVRDVAEEAEAQILAQVDDVQEHAEEKVATDVVPPTPTSPSPSSPVIPSSPPHQSPCPPQPQAAKASSHMFQQVLDTCSAIVLRVEGLENANATQQLEIVKLKARVKKLERLNKVKLSKLRRLKKVGTSQRVESSDDVENVFNQGRISVDMETDERVLSMQEDDTEVQEAVEVVTTTKLMTEVVIAAAATQVVAASTPIPVAKPKTLKIAAALAVSTRRRKGVVIRDPEEELHTDTPAKTPIVKDKGKGILIEDPKPMKKKDQVEMDAEYAKKLQEELDKEHEEAYKQIDWNTALDHSREEMEKEDEEIIKSINETPAQKAAKRRKLTTPLAQKVPVVDYQVVVIENKHRYKIIRADDTHQFYISFTTLLKNFDREDLETLWRIVRDRFSTSKPTNFLDEYLLLTLKTMFRELDEQDAIWRNQKSVHGLALVKRWKLLTSVVYM